MPRSDKLGRCKIIKLNLVNTTSSPVASTFSSEFRKWMNFFRVTKGPSRIRLCTVYTKNRSARLSCHGMDTPGFECVLCSFRCEGKCSLASPAHHKQNPLTPQVLNRWKGAGYGMFSHFSCFSTAISGDHLILLMTPSIPRVEGVAVASVLCN